MTNNYFSPVEGSFTFLTIMRIEIERENYITWSTNLTDETFALTQLLKEENSVTSFRGKDVFDPASDYMDDLWIKSVGLRLRYQFCLCHSAYEIKVW